MFGSDIPDASPPPAPSDTDVTAAKTAERDRQRKRRGRASTLLTGASGDVLGAEDVSRATLLGGGR